MVLTLETLRLGLFDLHAISMKYLYNRFRTTTLVNNKSIYGSDSVAFIKYADDYGFIIKETGEIKEMPDKFFPQALVFEIKMYVEKLTIV